MLEKILLILTVLLSTQVVFAQNQINLKTGQQSTIPVPPGSEVHIGDRSIITVRPISGSNTIILTGKRAGTTTLTIVLPGGEIIEKSINVIQRDVSESVKNINETIGTIDGVDFLTVGSQIIAKGKIFSIDDKRKLYKAIELFPEIVNVTEDFSEKRMVSISINIIEIGTNKDREYNNTDLPKTNVEYSKSGTSVDFSKIFLQKAWSYGFSTSDVINKFAFWVSNGKARVIANPNLAVTEGDTAKFFSGGEIAFNVQTRDGMAVEWKSWGVDISIEPVILQSGRILLNMTAEVSNVDKSVQGANGIPGITKRKTSSIGIVKPGETIALAGMYYNTSSKKKRLVPVIGYLLPFLFYSKADFNETKELIALVTPNLPSNIKKEDYPLINENLK